MLCLDTKIVIALLSGRRPAVRAQFGAARASGQPLALSTIALFELRYGADNSARSARNHAVLDAFLEEAVEVLPFDAGDAAEAGAIRAHLRPLGTPIGPYDILIAAQARRRGATFVTSNRREFERVPGLLVVDWADAP